MKYPFSRSNTNSLDSLCHEYWQPFSSNINEQIFRSSDRETFLTFSKYIFQDDAVSYLQVSRIQKYRNRLRWAIHKAQTRVPPAGTSRSAIFLDR